MASFLYTATAIGGGPESGALCYVFTRGTTTPAVSYSDSGLTTPTLNPIVADADGRIAPAYFDDSLDLTFRVKTADRATNLLRVDFRDGVFSVTYAQIDQLTLFEEDDTSDGAQTHVLTDCVVDNPWGVRILFDGVEQPVANYSVVTDGTDTTVTYATNCQPATGVRVLYKSAVLQALSPAAIDYSAIDISAAKVTPTAATEDSLANWLAAKVTASGGDASATVVTPAGGTTARSLAARFGDTLTISDFGAASDCTAVSTGTDDSAAVQAAFDWWDAAADRTLVINRRTRISSTCTANFAGRRGNRLVMLAPITPDPGIGNAFEFYNGNDVELYLKVRDGGQTATYSERDPAGADQAFVIRGIRGAIITYEGYNYKGRVFRATKEHSGEPKTSRLTILHAKTGDFGSAACGQNYYFDAGSAFGSISELNCFWDVYGPVAENIADFNITNMDGGWNAGNNGFELRGVVSFWAGSLSAGDETQTVDLFTVKPSVSDAVTHNATNYTALADSVAIEPGVTSGWASYWSASGGGGAAWSADKHYILGRNSANIDAEFFALKGAKGVILNNVGADGANSSGTIRVKSRENIEHGLHITTSSRLNVELDSVGDKVALETVGACRGKVHMTALSSGLQGLVVGSSGLELTFSGKIQSANRDNAAATSAVDVNSTGRDINFHLFNIETNQADYCWDLVASNFVSIVDCDTTISDSTVVMGTNAPRVARNVGGFRTENQGTATILSGATSVTVSHGLFFNPSYIEVTGRNSSEVGAPYVSGESSTQFTINVASAVTADRTLYWRAGRILSQA